MLGHIAEDVPRQRPGRTTYPEAEVAIAVPLKAWEMLARKSALERISSVICGQN